MSEKIKNNEDEQVKAQSVTVFFLATLFPIIWQSFVEALVFFFTTIGLESWWARKEKDSEKNKGE